MSSLLRYNIIGVFFIFLLSPIFVVIASSFTQSGLFSWPLDSLTLKWYFAVFTESAWLTALRFSFVVALAAGIGSVICTLLASFALARNSSTSAHIIRLILLLPLAFPHAATGVAFMSTLNKTGLLGTFSGIALAHIIITLPFAYRPISTALDRLDKEVIEASKLLGANIWDTIFYVILPQLKPAILVGLLFSILISFDETTITIFIIGTRLDTLPVKIFSDIQESPSPAIAAISTLLILFAFIAAAIVIYLQKRWSSNNSTSA